MNLPATSFTAAAAPQTAPELVPIPCTRCGASMAEDATGYLHGAVIARCGFCGNAETLPPDLAERIRFLRLRLLQLRNAADLAEAPARTVEQIRKTGGVYVPCVLLFGLVPLLSSSTVRGAELAFDTAAKNPTLGALLTMVGDLTPLLIAPSILTGVAIGYVMMVRNFNRAVRPLLTARPPRSPNGRARCRTCGGELAVTPAPSVRCSYCQATNLLGRELTTQRAELLDREAKAYRERAQAFGRAVSEPFKGPAHSFYASAAIVAASIFVLSNAASVVAVLVL